MLTNVVLYGISYNYKSVLFYHNSHAWPPHIAMSTTHIEREAVLSRQQIKDMITAGNYIVIVEQNVLKLDSWLDWHPGGTKVIEHMVGRNATDEVNA
jgi:cytochrome b involved in lipid metabolism